MLANTDSRPPRILTADLTWEPVHSLDVGHQVVTFDHTPTDHRYRMYRVGQVTGIRTAQTEPLRVTTTDGGPDSHGAIFASGVHRHGTSAQGESRVREELKTVVSAVPE